MKRFLKTELAGPKGNGLALTVEPYTVGDTAGPDHSATGPRRVTRRAYTLIEMLMSVALTLMMMLFVVQIFGLVGQSVDTSRAVLEMNDQLRSATDRIRKDLQGATADMNPPLSPEAGKGYFEVIEGPIGPVTPTDDVALNTDEPSGAGYLPDSTVADTDDILMFTSHSQGEPFAGRGFVLFPDGGSVGRQTIESPLAEICYFVRGTTLYRRVLLIKPEFDWNLTTPNLVEPLTFPNLYASGSGLLVVDPSVLPVTEQAFYNNFDLSVRFHFDAGNPNNQAAWVWVPNTLADLTKRENRFAHQPLGGAYPFDPHSGSDWRYLGLPTLRECSWCVNPSNPNGAWWPGRELPAIVLTDDDSIDQNAGATTLDLFDSWNNPLPFNEVDPETGTIDLQTGNPSPYLGPRVAEDVLLTNVVGFDVKVWDPGAPLYSVDVYGTSNDPTDDICLAPGDRGYAAAVAGGATPIGYGAYVDLGYAQTPPLSGLLGANLSWFSSSGGTPGLAYVYDTWSEHYETTGADGFDNMGNGIVDDVTEQVAPPPYARPLRGIQIKIRIFEPDSRRIREVTITHDFRSR